MDVIFHLRVYRESNECGLDSNWKNLPEGYGRVGKPTALKI